MKTLVWWMLFIIASGVVLIFASLANAEPGWKRVLREQRASVKKVLVCHVVRYEYKKINGKYRSVPITECEEK